MNERLVRWLATILTLSACTSALFTYWPHTNSIVTEDLNHDGRPDVWRIYDADHHLTEVFRDTNLDGQLDVREYYEHGALVRRESDRNFNNQIDLIEDFDAATGDRSRSVIDLDFDGRADLLVLLRGRDVVFVKTAPARASIPTRLAAPVQAPPGNVLLALDDPFSADLAVRPALAFVRVREFVGLSTAGGVPAVQRTALGVPLSTSHASSGWVLPPRSSERTPGSPRGPPLLSLSPNHL